MYLDNTPFLDNEFTRHYYQIIDKAQTRLKPDCYCEEHHIIPRSIGGTHVKSNRVILTAAEHFTVHRLLLDMTDGKHRSKMAYAFSIMCNTAKHHGYEPTPDDYQLAKTLVFVAIKNSWTAERKESYRLRLTGSSQSQTQKDSISAAWTEIRKQEQGLRARKLWTPELKNIQRKRNTDRFSILSKKKEVADKVSRSWTIDRKETLKNERSGTKTMHHPIMGGANRYVKPEDISSMLDNGWVIGRRPKINNDR